MKFQFNQERDFKGKYYHMLRQKEWFEKREQILCRDNYKCKCCDSKENLQCHHSYYKVIVGSEDPTPPWEYDDEGLFTLCKDCHHYLHKIMRIPKIQYFPYELIGDEKTFNELLKYYWDEIEDAIGSFASFNRQYRIQKIFG